MNSKKEDIRKLLEHMDVQPGKLSDALKEGISKMAMASVPDDRKGDAEKFLEEFFAPDPYGTRLLDAHVEAYSSRFSHIEIKDLLEFYESPAGRRWTEAVGDITKDILKANKKIVRDLTDTAHEGLRDAGIIPKDEEAEAAKNRILAGVTKRLSN
jgi:hypothetical protein